MESTLSNSRFSSQRGAGRINPAFADNLQNLAFIINDQILDNQVRAVIQKLVGEFNKMAANDLTDNLELSHFYAADQKLLSDKGITVCENCEIVLKYIDTAVCLTDTSAVKKFQNANDKIVHLTKDGKELECRLSKGLVKFYLKTTDKDTVKYSKIKVVKIISPTEQLDCKYALYQNNEEIERLNKVINAAVAHSQTQALVDSKVLRDIRVTSRTSMANAAEEVKKIVEKVKSAVNESSQRIKEISQTGGNGTETKVLTEVPSQETVNAASTVAEAVSQIPSKTVILVPESEPVVLGSGASIPVDASVVVAPTPVEPKARHINLLGDLAKSLFGAVKDIGSKLKLTAVTDKLNVMTASSQPVEGSIPKPTTIPKPIDQETLKTLKSQISAAARDAHTQLQSQLSTSSSVSSEKLSESAKRAKEALKGLTPDKAAEELEKILSATKKEYSEKRKMLEKTASDANKKISEQGRSIKAEADKISKELTERGRFLMSEADTETKKLIKEGEEALAAIQIELTEIDKGVGSEQKRKELLDKVHEISEKSDKLISTIQQNTSNFVQSASKATSQVKQQAEQATKEALRQAEQAAKQAAQSTQSAAQTVGRNIGQTFEQSIGQPLTEISLGFSESMSKSKPPLSLKVQQGGSSQKLYY